MRRMWSRLEGWRAAPALVALAALLIARAPEAQARPKKPYWMVSFVGGVLAPVGETADEREIGLGVGLRVGYTTRSGVGIAVSGQYSPLPVIEPAAMDGAAADDVTDNHFVAASVVPRFTLGRGTLRLTLGAGGGGIMEQTRSRPAGDASAPTSAVTVFAPSAVGELGLETHFWDSGGLVISGSYVRSFGEREAEVAAILGGLVFTFR
jgi:hypothetical protein